MKRKPKRGGKRPGSGRKPLGNEPMRRINVTLADTHIEKAKEIGNDNVSLGVRRAIERS